MSEYLKKAEAAAKSIHCLDYHSQPGTGYSQALTQRDILLAAFKGARNSKHHKADASKIEDLMDDVQPMIDRLKVRQEAFEEKNPQ